MANQMRMIPEDEYQRYMKYKSSLLNTGEKMKMHFLNDPNIPENMKVELYAKSQRRLMNKEDMLAESIDVPEASFKKPKTLPASSETGEKRNNSIKAVTPIEPKVELESRGTFTDPVWINRRIFQENEPAEVTHQAVQTHSTALRATSGDLEFLDGWKGDAARQNATMLLSVFRNFPKLIRWNKQGHCSFYNEEIHPEINLFEILEFCLRSRKKVSPPLGLDIFLLFVISCT